MPHVLVADDSQTVRTLLGTWLKAAGYEVSLAADGFAAVSLIQQSQQRLVIVLDQQMPYLSGVEVMETLMASPRSEQHKYIFMTATTPQSDVLVAVSQRLRATVLVKPFAAATFLSAVAQAIAW